MFDAETISMKPQIDPIVTEALKELSPWVRHIRYEVRPDGAGDLALLFRVVLSDKASRSKASRLSVMGRVRDQIRRRVFVPDLGLSPVFLFRSESEQAKMKDPAWTVN
jgi:hypothetical protein